MGQPPPCTASLTLDPLIYDIDGVHSAPPSSSSPSASPSRPLPRLYSSSIVIHLPILLLPSLAAVFYHPRFADFIARCSPHADHIQVLMERDADRDGSQSM